MILSMLFLKFAVIIKANRNLYMIFIKDICKKGGDIYADKRNFDAA